MTRRRLRCAGLGHGLAVLLLFATSAASVSAQKTDKIELRNGDTITGEIVRLDEGRVEFETSGMRTIQVKWGNVLTIQTDKQFEIVMVDRQIFIGSLDRADGGMVVLRIEGGDTLTVLTRSVVRLMRLRDSVWAALDGSVTAGVAYTQQDNRYDVNLGFDLEWIGRGFGYNVSRANLTQLSTEVDLTYQEQSEDQVRMNAALGHFREFGGGWTYLASLAYDRNSQLSLDYRTGVGIGVGRILLETYRAGVAVWIKPTYSIERFLDESASSSFPFEISGQLGVYNWDPVDTDISLLASILPLLGEGGRYRFTTSIDASHELVNDVYLMLGVREAYDSRPGAADANKNDLALNLGFRWKF